MLVLLFNNIAAMSTFMTLNNNSTTTATINHLFLCYAAASRLLLIARCNVWDDPIFAVLSMAAASFFAAHYRSPHPIMAKILACCEMECENYRNPHNGCVWYKRRGVFDVKEGRGTDHSHFLQYVASSCYHINLKPNFNMIPRQKHYPFGPSTKII